MRGEEALQGIRPGARCGSPPHTRGRGVSGTYNNTRLTDHPRIRGEESMLYGSIAATNGSPPHARGRG